MKFKKSQVGLKLAKSTQLCITLNIGLAFFCLCFSKEILKDAVPRWVSYNSNWWMETSTEDGIPSGLVTLICMIIPTRTSSQDSARINYFLIISSYILCGRIIAPVIRTAFAKNAPKKLMYQSQRTVSFFGLTRWCRWSTRSIARSGQTSVQILRESILVSSRNMLPKVMLTWSTANQLLSFLLLNILLAMLDKDLAEIDYKEVQELLVQPRELKIVDEGNKLTIFAKDLRDSYNKHLVE